MFKTILFLFFSSYLYASLDLSSTTLLPPTPNPIISDQTLGGTDHNTNGIRDDIEIFIHLNYSGRENEFLLKVAKEIQKLMFLEHSASNIDYISENVFTICTEYEDLFLEADSFEFHLILITKKIANTKERQAHLVWYEPI